MKALKCIDHSKISYTQCDFNRMTPAEKKHRIKFLWFKVRTVYNVMVFIASLKDKYEAAENEQEDHAKDNVILDEDLMDQNPKIFCGFTKK